MAVILSGVLSGIAVLLVSLPFWIIRVNVGKRALSDLRRQHSELKEQLDAVQNQLNILAQRPVLKAPSASFVEVERASSEIALLKTELGTVRRDLDANSRTLSLHTTSIKALEEKQATLLAIEETTTDSLRLQAQPSVDPGRFPETDSLFPKLGTFIGLDSKQTLPTASDIASNQAPHPPPLEPFDQALKNYQDALDRGDRQALRQMQLQCLNITGDSEDSLIRGSSDQATKLEAVSGGGSYMVVGEQGRFWLFPTAQTLDSFSMNQPLKGIFSYESETLSKPAVKKPAEVKEEGGHWAVINQGIILVPG